MAKYRQILLLLFGAVFFFVMGGVVLSKSFQSNKLAAKISPSTEVKSAEAQNSDNEIFKVERVVDGDTIVLEGGKVLRYIGIDTPETKDPRKEVQCFGETAANENMKLVEGKIVRLQKDVSETDRYGRLLRYVWIGDLFVNDYLVKEGFAHASSYPPDVKYQEVFSKSEGEARNLNKGLWAECASSINQTSAPTNTPTASIATSTDSSKIDCSKNTYNCTSFKTQSEAQNVFDTCGGTSNDVHKLDRDGDGRVCETLPE